MQTGSIADSPLWQARLEALRETWIYARAQSTYYSELLPDIASEQLGWQHLHVLPICTREDLDRLQDKIRCRRDLPAFMVFTGGTSGRPHLVYGTEEEIRSTPIPRPADGSRLPLWLTTDGGHHGTAPLIPGHRGTIRVPTRNRKNYDWTWHLLTKEHEFEGFERKISYALLPTPVVKKLVHYVLSCKLDTSALALKALLTHSWHLTQAWRNLIEDTLAVPVVDNFGFTEICQAMAQECLSCGCFHYGRQAVWEVVDPSTHAPLDDGIGLLAVTSLYPYARDQLLFRYATGDLVEQGPPCADAGERGFRFRGRLSQSFAIVDGGVRRWLLLPTQVQEVIDRRHWMARLEEARFSGVSPTSDDSFPKWRALWADRERRTLRLELELCFNPALFPDDWRRLREAVTTGLFEFNADLAAAVGSGAVALAIDGLSPGSLAPSDVFIC